MLKVTFLQELTESTAKSQKSTNSATGQNVSPSKDSRYVVLYTFKTEDKRNLTVADFINMASEKTGIQLEASDFKKCILHF